MEPQPKKRRRHAFPYMLMGFLISFILVGLFLTLLLIYTKQPVTLQNIFNLSVSNMAFIYIDIIALYSALLWGFVGYQKDRAEDARQHEDWLAKNQQQELLKVQENQAAQEKQHQAEIAQINEKLVKEGSNFQDLEAIIRRGKATMAGDF